MGKLSTILGILTAILAIAAAALSFMLFQRRDEFRGRADKLATAVATMTAKLDSESGTNLQGAVNFTPADPVSKTPEDGTLGWQSYHAAKDETGEYAAFQETLNQAVKLAEDINRQRNALAENMFQIAVNDLQAPESELDPASLKDLADPDRFKQANELILDQAGEMLKRDTGMIQTLVTCGSIIGFRLDKRLFEEREEKVDENGNVTRGAFKCAAVLPEFTGKVTGLNTRCNAYASAISDGINAVSKHRWATDPGKIPDPQEFEAALTALANDFDEINEALTRGEVAQKRVKECETRMEDMVSELEQVRDDLNKAQDRIVELTIQRSRSPGGLDDIATINDAPPMAPDIEGKVVEVNRDWNFVILDLGWSRGITEGTEMLVARGDDLVAKVQVSKVLRKISIAEVLPEVNTDHIEVEDRVILPLPGE